MIIYEIVILSNTNEKEVILDMKSHLRDILYRAVDANANVYVSELDCKPNEFKLYFQMAQIALKKADQQLGLRLSEI